MMKHTTKPQNGDVRADGRRYDGTCWRKTGINHNFNEEGLVYYKKKFRSLKGYLKQGGNIAKLVFGKIKKPKDIAKVADLLYNKEKSGDVYVITNPSFKGWIKVGMAVDAKDRCNSYQTSSPFRNYKLFYSRWFEDRRSAENQAFSKLVLCQAYRCGEWFRINPVIAKEVIESL